MCAPRTRRRIIMNNVLSKSGTGRTDYTHTHTHTHRVCTLRPSSVADLSVGSNLLNCSIFGPPRSVQPVRTRRRTVLLARCRVVLVLLFCCFCSVGAQFGIDLAALPTKTRYENAVALVAYPAQAQEDANRTHTHPAGMGGIFVPPCAWPSSDKSVSYQVE